MPQNQDVEIAVLKSQVQQLTRQMEKLTEQLEHLTTALNRSRGAFWAASILGSMATIAVGGLWAVYDRIGRL